MIDDRDEQADDYAKTARPYLNRINDIAYEQRDRLFQTEVSIISNIDYQFGINLNKSNSGVRMHEPEVAGSGKFRPAAYRIPAHKRYSQHRKTVKLI